jgi:HEAT repeat protein
MNSPASNQLHSKESAKAAKNVVISLFLALKKFSLYPEDHNHCRTAMGRLQQDLETFLDDHGKLVLRVEKDRILFEDRVIHEGEAREGDLAFALFRDAIYRLSFHKGIDSRQIDQFIRILNQYRTLPPEAEGDIVTALWEAQLPHLKYEADDKILEADLEVDLSQSEKEGTEESDFYSTLEMLLDTEASPAGSDGDRDLPPLEPYSLQLTPEEVEILQEMVRGEEERDPTQEILDMLADILKDQRDEEYFDVVLDYIEEELQTALGRKGFDIALRILKRLIQIRMLCQESSSWALSRINEFFLRVCEPDFLTPLQEVWPTLSAREMGKLKLILLLLPPKAIGALGARLLEAPSPAVQEMLSEVILSLASRDFTPFEKLLDTAEENLLCSLVPLLGLMSDEESSKALIHMVHHPSERVRKEALSAIMVRDLWVPEQLTSLMDDENTFIRQILIKYLGSRRSEAAELLLLDYLRNRKYRNTDHEHVSACFRALGRCGKNEAIPFLRDTLLRGNWISRFRVSVLREYAALALKELGTDKAKQILEEGSQSWFPGIRGSIRVVMQV